MRLSQSVALLFLAAFLSFAAAQQCTWEIEPNDAPHQATPVTGAGPATALSPGRNEVQTACLAGELTRSDQDMFVWDVSEEQADQRWAIDLFGTDGMLIRLDLIHLTFLDDGPDVTSRTDLLTIQTMSSEKVSSPEFLLAPGRYFIGLSRAGGSGEYTVHLRPGADLRSGSRDYRARRAQEGQFRIFGMNPGELEQEWTLPEDEADFLWSLTYETGLGNNSKLKIAGPDGQIATLRTGVDGRAQLNGLSLEAGTYTLRAEGDPAMFHLAAERQGRRGEGIALKPDNEPSQATHFPPGTQMRGTLTRRDWFRMEVAEEQARQAWALSMETDGSALHLNLENEQGQEILRRRNASGHIDDLTLPAGVYHLMLSGSDGTEYTLDLSAAEQPEEGFEVEPNDTPAAATPLGDARQARGRLSADNDTDVFSFEVSGQAAVYRLQLISQARGSLTVLDGNGQKTASTRAGQRVRLDNLALSPGTHYVEITGSEGEYGLRILELGPVPEPAAVEDLPAADEPLQPAAPAPEPQPLAEAVAAMADAELPALQPPPPGMPELEPNDEQSRADRLLPGVPRVGTLTAGDVDTYRFFLAEDQLVRLELVPPEGGEPLMFTLSEAGRIKPARGAEPGTPTLSEQWLKAGDHWLTVQQGDTGDAWYQLRLTLLNGALPTTDDEDASPAAAAPPSLSLGSDAAEVAAFLNYGQQLTATAEITNTNAEAQVVQLSSHLSDARFSADHPDRLELAGGETAIVPVTVTLPADLRTDVPVQISLAATGDAGSSGTHLSIPARCQALPVNPRWHWPVPEPLLGGIDVLWNGLGAEIHDNSIPAHAGNALIDGRASPAADARLDQSPPVFRLAGESPTEIIGALLHPLGRRETAQQLQRFRLETSTDGKEFTTAFEGELKAARIEQAFVFPEPVTARYVRLVAESSQSGGQQARLGELKLIARDRAPFGSFDLANPDTGGHIVWTEPAANRDFLHSHRTSERVDLRDDEQFTFVLAFHNSRAALISGLEWGGDLEAGEEPFERVSIEVSLTGAAGPFEPLTDWELHRNADGRALLELDAPVWARYLRFTADKTREGQHRWPLPRELVVREAEAHGDYRSILGEWGIASPYGIYEHLNAPALPDYDGLHRGNGTRADALALASGETAEGTILIGVNEAWYELEIEEGDNHLAVHLSGDPLISYAWEVTDARGKPVSYREHEDDSGVTLSFHGEPGTYVLRLSEPKRSVVFSWDTSASMGPYLSITYNVLAAFAAAVDGEKESVQLLAYDKPVPQWLLPRFSSDREKLQLAVNSFDRSASSSNSEQPIIMAATALAERDGARALLLVTDAETTGSHLATDVWRALEGTRLRIFTFEVNSYGSLHSQQYMQDWALANGGHYALATTIGDLEAGHDRAACLLAAPKHYRVSPESSSETAWEAASPWAESELDRALQLDLIPDSLVGSDLTGSITRAEFAGVAVRVYERLAGVATEPVADNPFTDTDDDDVLRAFNTDLAVGISDTEFEPDSLLNREQAATILTRVVKKYSLPGWTWDEDADYELEFRQPEPFADDDRISPWARDSVYFMAANGIITGTGDNSFSPRAVTPEEQAVNFAGATREQALALAVRMVENLGRESVEERE